MAEEKKEKIKKVIQVLKKTYPDAKCELNYHSPYQLLVSTILSAQCTDVRVNMVTPGLFKKYPTPQTMAKASLKSIEELIHSTGFYSAKAKSLSESAKAIVAQHDGEVPDTMSALTALRGVGRKTANVVLGNAFGKAEGIVVDTHVGRLMYRMGFTKNKDPKKVEKDLCAIVPQKEWTLLSHLLIFHGRRRCMARNPNCKECELQKTCPQVGVVKK